MNVILDECHSWWMSFLMNVIVMNAILVIIILNEWHSLWMPFLMNAIQNNIIRVNELLFLTWKSRIGWNDKHSSLFILGINDKVLQLSLPGHPVHLSRSPSPGRSGNNGCPAGGGGRQQGGRSGISLIKTFFPSQLKNRTNRLDFFFPNRGEVAFHQSGF